MTVLIADPTRVPLDKHCARCTLEHIKKQVKGLARVYVRSHPTNRLHEIGKPWVLYIVPKGQKLVDVQTKGNWQVEVGQFPYLHCRRVK